MAKPQTSETATVDQRRPPRVVPIRIGLALAVIVFVAWGLGVRSSYATAERHSTLQHRGRIATATVDAISYDSDGGDPGGVTTIHAHFVTPAGERVEATVYHHYQPTETVGGEERVIYDPRSPSNVEIVNAQGLGNTFSDFAFGLVMWAGFAITVVVLIILERHATRRYRELNANGGI